MNYKSRQTNKNISLVLAPGENDSPSGRKYSKEETGWGKTTKGIKLRSERLNSG